jgi:non-specific serine/threonine protein kinase
MHLVSSLGLGACLADDMGLGKTIEVLALLLILARQNAHETHLLVVPASLIGNWLSEIARFAPSLRAHVIHASAKAPAHTQGARATRRPVGPSGLDPLDETHLSNIDLVITTYGMLLRAPWIAARGWGLVLLDEAQAIKNPSAKQTRAVKTLHGRSRIALTGTPVENHLSDLWSLFDFLSPGLLGSERRFSELSRKLEERGSYAPLRALVRPYVLRRLKTDRKIIQDLPEKTEVVAFCTLSRKQVVLYERIVTELEETLAQATGMQRRGAVLATLMRLKQVCNHPSQLLGDEGFARKDSGKMLRVAELCDEIAQRQERVLVFTQFREMTGPLSSFLAEIFGAPGMVLHGGTPVGKRREMVERFQRDDGPPFFVISLKAGGVGLNLTGASHVIHFDRWWNPAVENQATDRAFRIGQKRNVLVHKLVCKGTVEERIDAMITAKQKLSDEVLSSTGEAILTEMDDAALLALVRLDVSAAMDES